MLASMEHDIVVVLLTGPNSPLSPPASSESWDCTVAVRAERHPDGLLPRDSTPGDAALHR